MFQFSNISISNVSVSDISVSNISIFKYFSLRYLTHRYTKCEYSPNFLTQSSSFMFEQLHIICYRVRILSSLKQKINFFFFEIDDLHRNIDILQ